jgi:hypothetical protein
MVGSLMSRAQVGQDGLVVRVRHDSSGRAGLTIRATGVYRLRIDELN